MKWLRRSVVVSLFMGLLVGGWAFAGRNLEPVEIDYLVGEISELQLWKALLVAGALGAGAALLPLTVSLLRVRLVARRYRKALAGLEAELEEVRLAVEKAGSGEQGVPGG